MRRGRRATDGSIYADGAHRCGENNGNDSFCAPPLCAAPITTDNCGASGFLHWQSNSRKNMNTFFRKFWWITAKKTYRRQARELAARWDSPVIITTSVRFFESLFSANPQSCRKLHHIANSVVLFDEAQSLPRRWRGQRWRR